MGNLSQPSPKERLYFSSLSFGEGWGEVFYPKKSVYLYIRQRPGSLF